MSRIVDYPEYDVDVEQDEIANILDIRQSNKVFCGLSFNRLKIHCRAKLGNYYCSYACHYDYKKICKST